MADSSESNYGDKHDDKGFNKKIKRTISRFSR